LCPWLPARPSQPGAPPRISTKRITATRAAGLLAALPAFADTITGPYVEIHGYGGSTPLVPTAKGVREPENRRVEIILH
jgi:outer membrane protein OmpA-like peptidoglycan-associated protein